MNIHPLRRSASLLLLGLGLSPIVNAQVSPSASLTLDSKNAPTAPNIADISGNKEGALTREFCPVPARVATVDDEPVDPPTEPRDYTLDVAMDESGKLEAVGRADGVLDKNGSPDFDAGGSVKTVDGNAVVDAKASAAGTVDGEPSRGGGAVILSTQVEDGAVDGTAKATSSLGGEKDTVKPSPVSVDVSPEEEQQIKTDWTFDVVIERALDSKGSEVVLASATLELPNGDRTAFSPKRVKYNTRKGYAIRFGQGTKVDVEGSPLLDSKGNPIKDKKSRMVLTSLVFAGSGENWEVTGGDVEFNFLGQKGKWGVMDFLN